MTIHRTNGTEVEINTEDVDSITFDDIYTFDLLSGKNGEAPTIRLSSGYDMPIVGMGCYALHDDVCRNAILSAIRLGFRKFDTASFYGNEAEVGDAIRQAISEGLVTREELFVTTKLYPGSEFAQPEQAIERCLSKLNIGYVDLMLLHHPGTNDVKAYQAMEQYVAQGKIRSLGVSNFYISEMTDFLTKVDTKPVLVQNEIHPYYQERDVVRFMQRQGIVVEGWYPLGGRGFNTELLSDPVIQEIADRHGKSLVQTILRWDLQNGVVVIPGSQNPDHQQENISIFDFQLTREEMNAIDALNRDEKHDWY